MSSVIDRILLNETVTREEVESLNDNQKPYVYRLIYYSLPLDKYYTTVEITEANLDHFSDSPIFREYILYVNNTKNLDPASLREFIENYPESKWMTKDIREHFLFTKCNVVKSPLSIYINELYTLHTLRQFPKCWKLLLNSQGLKKSKIKSLEILTECEEDCIKYGKFIMMYDMYAYKESKGLRRDVNVLAYIMREIITLCEYSTNLTNFKVGLLIKYYAIISDHENVASLQLIEFTKLKSVPSLTDLILTLSVGKQYINLERLILENLELFYTLAQSFRGEFLTPTIINAVLKCSTEFRSQMELIFNNHFRKYMARNQKRTIYYLAFILDSECLLCCKTTDNILKCINCNKTTCCTGCAYKVDMRKCMMCRSSV